MKKTVIAVIGLLWVAPIRSVFAEARQWPPSSQEISRVLKAPKYAAPTTGPTTTIVETRTVYKVPLKDLFAKQKCADAFRQVNGNEPLATCAVDVDVPGVIKPVVGLPVGLHGEFDSEIGADAKVGCTGGIRGDAGLAGQIQIFVGLSPWGQDYSKEQFKACFESVISKLQAKDRVLYFEATQSAK